MSGSDASEPAASPAIAKNNQVDAVVAVLVFIVGVVVIIESQRLGAGWTSDGPGSGYFPFYIGLILSISGVGIFYQSVFSKSRDTRTFVDREQLVRVLSVLIPAAVYVFIIMFLGLYLASTLYIAGFMIVLGHYPKVKSALIGIGISVFFFLLFEVWFKVPLYKGRWDLLSFLGY